MNSYISRECSNCGQQKCNQCKAGTDIVYLCGICDEPFSERPAAETCCADLMAKDSEVGTIPIVRTKTQRPFPENQYSNAENERTY